ncbi:MAG TPA: hypothetical protein QGF58_29675 [Myxococcota bacterium]|nr:hypothetical protein [Myxococcota bacterium]
MPEEALSLPARLALIAGIILVLVVAPLYLSGTFDETVEVTVGELAAMGDDDSGTKFGVTAEVEPKTELDMGIYRKQSVAFDGTPHSALRRHDDESRATVWFDPDEVSAPSAGEEVTLALDPGRFSEGSVPGSGVAAPQC